MNTFNLRFFWSLLLSNLYDFFLGFFSIILKIVETIIFKIVPCFLIMFSFIAFTLCNNLEFTIGMNLYLFISLLFFLSNIFTIHLLFTTEKRSSHYWKTIKTLINNPILIVQLFVLIIIMYAVRNSIINNAIPMDSRSIIVIFYVVISLLPLSSLYFTVIHVTLHFKSTSELKFHKLYYNNCKGSINGAIILIVFIYMIFIRLLYVAFASNFGIENYGVLALIVCNLTYIGSVFMENYDNDLYEFINLDYNPESHNSEPNSPNPGPQDTQIPIQAEGEDSNDRLEDIQDAQRPLTCVNSDAKDLDDMEHRDSTFYCKLGIAKIKENILSKNVDSTLYKIVHQMTLRNITCKNLFNILPLHENNIVLKKHPINLLPANNDPAIYKLASKIANLISTEIVGKNVKIIFGNNRFEKLSLYDWTVEVQDIWDKLSAQEIELFKKCIIANRSYYGSIRVKGSTEINLRGHLCNPPLGFSIPNNINKYGLAKAFSNMIMNSNRGVVKQPRTLSLPEFEHNNNHPEHEKVESAWFCADANQRLHEISTLQKMEIDTVRTRLFNAGVKCKYLLKHVSVQDGPKNSTASALDLSRPHTNINIFNLATKLANLTTEVVESRYPTVHFSKKHFSSLAFPSWKVVYSEISNNLTLAEKILFVKCIKTNPSHYKNIVVTNDDITPNSPILTDKTGFKIINNINELGDDKHPNLRTLYKREALKRGQGEVDLQDRAESSKSSKLD